MARYEYNCRDCKKTISEIRSIDEPPIDKCPYCESKNIVRDFDVGGIRFKGSGFYSTDHGSIKQ